jgi:four helix bundle protein
MTNKEFKRQLIKRAYIYALKVMKLSDKFPNRRSYWIITDQLLRAATSIGANIIEAQSASSKRDFIRFLEYALKSANESKFWLGLLKDSKNIKEEVMIPIITETNELAKILASIILNLKGKKKL